MLESEGGGERERGFDSPSCPGEEERERERETSQRGAGDEAGVVLCLVYRGVTTRKNGSHFVVLCRCQEYPKADH